MLLNNLFIKKDICLVFYHKLSNNSAHQIKGQLYENDCDYDYDYTVIMQGDYNYNYREKA